MIGIVVVSHSPALAEAAIDLALQMVPGDRPTIEVAAGSHGHFGTDATAVATAIEQAGGAEGVLVITDLGSAVLSSTLALELAPHAFDVEISDGPFVEGVTAAVVMASTGAPLRKVAAETSNALAAKRVHLTTAPKSESTNPTAETVTLERSLLNADGLHARPAAMVVRALADFDAWVEMSNLSTGAGPVAASSLVGLLSLGGHHGHRLRLDASGPQAPSAISRLQELLDSGFGELTDVHPH